MGTALVLLPSRFGAAVFSLGVLVLGSDYKILKMLSLNRQYRWVQAKDDLVRQVERDYQAVQFIERGPGKIDLQILSGGNFRAHINQTADCIYPGLRFRIYVEAPVNNSSDLQYHLRLGTAEVTRVSEVDDDSQIAFFTLREWETDFEDNHEKEFAEAARREILRSATSDVHPFAKIAEEERVNEFEIEEWKAIHDWGQE